MYDYNSAETLHAPILNALNLPWRGIINPSARIVLPPQSWLAQTESTSLDFYYLAKGKIMLMHVDADGNERGIFSVGPGNLINEAPAVAGFDAPNSPFFSIGECLLFRFSHTLLHDSTFVASHPELIINLMRGLAIKLLIMHTSLSNFTGVNALMRVSRFFYSLALHRNQLNFDPGITQDSLATLLGMNRATLVRVLHELKECGAITHCTKHKLVIEDMDLLRKLAGA